MQSLSLKNRYIEKTTQQETLLNPFMRVSYIGITSAFQPEITFDDDEEIEGLEGRFSII